MPCLTDTIDCLLCGERTACSQVAGSQVDDPKKHWTVFFCKLFSIEDETLQDAFRQSFFCVQCACKITSIEKISSLVQDMTTKLEEIRTVVEDNIYLSNTHLLMTTDGESEEKNQNGVRERMAKVLEDIRKKKIIPTYADACMLTDPVMIVECNDVSEPGPTQVIVLPDSAGREDKECQCTLIPDPMAGGINSAGGGTGSGERSNKQLIKMLIKSDSVSEDIIRALTAPNGNSGTRQLIIRGYREVEHSEDQSVEATTVESNGPESGAKKARGRPAGSKNKSRRIPPHVCKICRDDYQTPEATRAHVESHKEGNLWKCPQCIYTATTERSLIRHVSKHYNEELEKSQEQDGSGATENNSVAMETKSGVEGKQGRPRRNIKRKRKVSTSEEEEEEVSEEEEASEVEAEEDEEEVALEDNEEDENFEEEEEESSEDESIQEESPRRSGRKRVSTYKVSKSSTGRKKSKQTKTQMVIKVPSNKRISSSMFQGSAEADDAVGASPLGTRLRSRYRTYFH